MTSTPCSITPRRTRRPAPVRTAACRGRRGPVGAGEVGEGDTERVGDVSVELVGNRSSDVVRLDDLVESDMTGGRGYGWHRRGSGLGSRCAGSASTSAPAHRLARRSLAERAAPSRRRSGRRRGARASAPVAPGSAVGVHGRRRRRRRQPRRIGRRVGGGSVRRRRRRADHRDVGGVPDVAAHREERCKRDADDREQRRTASRRRCARTSARRVGGRDDHHQVRADAIRALGARTPPSSGSS